MKLRVVEGEPGIWLGERHFPHALCYIKKEEFPPDALGGKWGYVKAMARIPAENGMALSVTWGSGTYSSNYETLMPGEDEWDPEPTMVEIAFIDERGSFDAFITLDTEDQVLAYVEIPEVILIYDWMTTLSSKWDDQYRVPVGRFLVETLDKLSE